MSVPKNFKNIPRSPYGGRHGSNVFFLFKFATKSLEEKKEGGLSPPNGRQAPVAHPRGDHPVGPPGGPVTSPAGDRGGATGSASLYKAPLIPSSHLTSKKPKKSRKKRGVRRREAAKLCQIILSRAHATAISCLCFKLRA